MSVGAQKTHSLNPPAPPLSHIEQLQRGVDDVRRTPKQGQVGGNAGEHGVQDGDVVSETDRGRQPRVHLAAVHHLLPHVHLAKGLQEGEDGEFQALAGAFGGARGEKPAYAFASAAARSADATAPEPLGSGDCGGMARGGGAEA